MQKDQYDQILKSDSKFSGFKNFENQLDDEFTKPNNIKDIEVNVLQNSDEKLDLINDFLEKEYVVNFKNVLEKENDFEKISEFMQHDINIQDPVEMREVQNDSPTKGQALMDFVTNSENPGKTSDILEMFGNNYKGCESCKKSNPNLQSKKHYVYMKRITDGNSNLIKEKQIEEQTEKNNYFSQNVNSNEYYSGSKFKKRHTKGHDLAAINTKYVKAQKTRSNSKSQKTSYRSSNNDLRLSSNNVYQKSTQPSYRFSQKNKNENFRQQESSPNKKWYSCLKQQDMTDFFDSNSIHHPNYWTDIEALKNFLISPRTRNLDNKSRKSKILSKTNREGNFAYKKLSKSKEKGKDLNIIGEKRNLKHNY